MISLNFLVFEAKYYSLSLVSAKLTLITHADTSEYIFCVFSSFYDTAEYAELPLLPPFLQPNADYSNGANFASGGAGVLAETHQGLVKSLNTLNEHVIFERLLLVS